MKLDALNRIRHLSELATARNLAARDLADRLRSVRDEKRRLQDRRDHVASNQFANTNSEAELNRIDQRMTDLDDTISDLDHRQQDANAAFYAAKTLETRCREFAKENGLPVPETVIGDRDSYDGPRMQGDLGMVQQGGGA